jgi:hypothetical protein
MPAKRIVVLTSLFAAVLLVLAGCTPVTDPTAFVSPLPAEPLVSILVVDDFEPPRCTLNWEADELDAEFKNYVECVDAQQKSSVERNELAGKNCAFTPDGQAHFASRGTAHFGSRGVQEGILVSPPVSHGELVHMVLEDLLGRSDEATRQSIEIVDVPTDGYTTESIQMALEEAISSRSPAKGFVINMSFVIMPCDQFPDLAQYLAALEAAPAGQLEQVLEELVGAWRSQIETCYTQGDCRVLRDSNEDPLYRYYQELGRDRIILVGAAGNSHEAFPYAPAAWDMVVSASADENYSNAGEVRLSGILSFAGPGHFLVLQPMVIGDTVHLMPRAPKQLEGTSFAAPELSYQAAVYLLNDGPIACSGTAGAPAWPLKYAPITGTYDNLDLPVAEGMWCAGFPTAFPPP